MPLCPMFVSDSHRSAGEFGEPRISWSYVIKSAKQIKIKLMKNTVFWGEWLTKHRKWHLFFLNPHAMIMDDTDR